jgi:hypothetical protein
MTSTLFPWLNRLFAVFMLIFSVSAHTPFGSKTTWNTTQSWNSTQNLHKLNGTRKPLFTILKPNATYVPIHVKITKTDGPVLAVTVTNRHFEELNLFKRMTILDPNPVQKVEIRALNGKSPYRMKWRRTVLRIFD